MSEWKEVAAKRRDSRHEKIYPDTSRRKSRRKKKPFIVLARYEPEYFERNKDYWMTSRWSIKNNNQWRKYASFSKAEGAEQAIASWQKESWMGKMEYMIIDTSTD